MNFEVNAQISGFFWFYDLQPIFNFFPLSDDTLVQFRNRDDFTLLLDALAEHVAVIIYEIAIKTTFRFQFQLQNDVSELFDPQTMAHNTDQVVDILNFIHFGDCFENEAKHLR